VLRVRFAGGLRSVGGLRATIGLRTGAFLAGAFLEAVFFLEGDFLLAFFLLATGFFLLAFFATGLFFDTFLAPERFLEAAFFFATFFFETFFRLADFFAAGFLREAVFFLDDFFAAAFFLLTFRLFPEVFFLFAGLLLAAFFREALTGLRFLLGFFFAGIFCSYRSEKNAQLYIARVDMEALKKAFLPAISRLGENVCISEYLPANRAGRPELAGLSAKLSFPGDNRFMLAFTLHYCDYSWRQAHPSKCDLARSSLRASNHSSIRPRFLFQATSLGW